MVRNSSSETQKDEIQSRKSLSDHVNQSKEQGPENVSGITNISSSIIFNLYKG